MTLDNDQIATAVKQLVEVACTESSPNQRLILRGVGDLVANFLQGINDMAYAITSREQREWESRQ